MGKVSREISPNPLVNAERVSAELVRALRGKRSCAALSRRLGYRSNIVRRWEAEECWPTASTFFESCVKLKPSTRNLFPKFFQRTPDWFNSRAPFAPSGIAAFLQQLRGKTPIGTLAARTQTNRYTLGRWLSSKAQPSLPEFLRLVEATSRRGLDLIALIVDPRDLPSLEKPWNQLQAAREIAYNEPWSHAVLRALEIADYGENDSGILARQLGISNALATRGLEALAQSGQIRLEKGRWKLDRVFAVDTSRDPGRANALKSAWTEVALERLRRGGPGNFGYSLFAVSRADLRRLRELHLEYIRAMQSLIASSAPAECVGLYCAQLLDLNAVESALSVSPEAATSSRQ